MTSLYKGLRPAAGVEALACEVGVDNHLVGDGAYPLQQWLLTPLRNNGHLTQRMRRFNYRLSSARVAIEHAFGLLKGRAICCLKLLDTKNCS